MMLPIRLLQRLSCRKGLCLRILKFGERIHKILNHTELMSKYTSLIVDNFDVNHPEMKETRKGFADALVELGKENPDVVVLGGDVSPSVRVDQFRDAYPDRFFSVGISEQDMMGVA